MTVSDNNEDVQKELHYSVNGDVVEPRLKVSLQYANNAARPRQ